MTTAALEDLGRVLGLTPDLIAVFTGDENGEDGLRERVVAEIGSGGHARELFGWACEFRAPFGAGWIHGPGSTSDYLSLELAAEVLAPDDHRLLLRTVVLSGSASIPYDYRARAAEQLVRLGIGGHADDFLAVVESYRPASWRTLDAKTRISTDGIDHLFPVPETVQERLRLLVAASAVKTEETRYLLASRVLGREPALVTRPSALLSATAEEVIAADVRTSTVEATDYLVGWDQELAVAEGTEHVLTLAELMRITLLCPEFKLPDTAVRPVLIDFYRSVLRVSGRSIIGLAAGVFYVEHGAEAPSSYFYMGRDSVIGKGCVVDCVGGAVLSSGSFLGGGFMPILVHTHKHIRKSGAPGVSERKQVLPCVFVAETGARLPMHAIGIFETADYLGQDGSPIPGIRAVALDNGFGGTHV